MEKEREYQLILRMPFKALDDAAARQKATEYLHKVETPSDMIVKLQRLREGQPPEGIEL